MNNKKSEQRLILIIRYSLPIFILFITILISLFISYEHEKNIKSEKKYIEKNYIEEQKEQIKLDLTQVYNYIDEENNKILLNLKTELKNKIESIYSIVNSIYENNKNKKSKEEILKQIKYAIQDIRFSDGKGYFFIFKMDGDVLLNPLFPHLEGKNLWKYKDSRGKYLIQEMNQILKTKNETYYNWYWKDPLIDEDKEFLKIGFFKKFEPFDIFIGTGYYLDDYINSLKNSMIDYISKLRYKDQRYIFVVDYQGNLLTNKHKSILNENIYKKESLKSFVKIFDEIKNKNQKVDTYYNYDLIIDGEKEPIKKISYFLSFAEWNWIIGTGFTLESINSVIDEKQNFLVKKYKEYLNNIYFIGFFFIIMILIILYFISKYIEKSFYNYTSSLENKQKILLKSQEVGSLGDWYLNINTMQAYWSESTLKILGIKEVPKSVGPIFLKQIIHKDDWNNFEKSINSTIQNGKEHHCIYRIFTANNDMKWIECRGEIDFSSNRIIGVIQDITVRKEFELDKEKKEQLLYHQSKMAAMGEMIGNIAHQWRQPLSVISTASTGIKLKKEMKILSDDDLISTMESINDSTQYLSQTIEDFRNFFSPTNKALKVLKASEVFEKTLKLITPQFISKSIHIVKNIVDIEFKSLHNELIQVFINILNNAKDALMDKNKNEEKYIFINCFEKKNNTIIEIYDNAKGIDKEIISRIFEPYFTTKYKSQGTGIGLYMSQEIINKLLKAELLVENIDFKYKDKEYKGAKFTIKIKKS